MSMVSFACIARETGEGTLQFELSTSIIIALGSVKHVDAVLESGLDDIFGGIGTDLSTDGEP